MNDFGLAIRAIFKIWLNQRKLKKVKGDSSLADLERRIEDIFLPSAYTSPHAQRAAIVVFQ
jgi:hypothetical protein